MSNADTVSAFFAQHGLSHAAISGILGNLQVESNFNPAASNDAEGAIGIGQWEGGRRTALQQYAAAHGGTETDLNTQLGFMWQELQGSKSDVLKQLQTVTDPAQAATLWDSQYEVSSGSSRTQRISNAQLFYSGSAPQGGGTQVTSASTADTYKQAMSALSGLFNSNPELQSILNQAVAGQWTTDRFQQAIDSSQWYKTNSATVRSNLAQQATDPATWAKNLQSATDTINQRAAQMGIQLTGNLLPTLANAYLMGGWTDAQLQENIGYQWQQTQGTTPNTGQAAGIQAQLQQIAANYGIPVGKDVLSDYTSKLLMGHDTIDGFTNYAKTVAKSMYPTLAAQIDAGVDVKTIADPYVTTKANLLEVDPATINFSQDSGIKQALQGYNPAGTPTTGSGSSTSAGTTPANGTPTPLWQFENQVRQDPRWDQTHNAQASAYSMVSTLGKQWGFST